MYVILAMSEKFLIFFLTKIQHTELKEKLNCTT